MVRKRLSRGVTTESESDLSSPTQTTAILQLSPVRGRIATAGVGRGAAVQAVGDALSVTGLRQRREGRFALTLCF